MAACWWRSSGEGALPQRLYSRDPPCHAHAARCWTWRRKGCRQPPGWRGKGGRRDLASLCTDELEEEGMCHSCRICHAKARSSLPVRQVPARPTAAVLHGSTPCHRHRREVGRWRGKGERGVGEGGEVSGVPWRGGRDSGVQEKPCGCGMRSEGRDCRLEEWEGNPRQQYIYNGGISG